MLQALEYAGWWVDEMAAARHPLRERMVLFWHGFFTSSAKSGKSEGRWSKAPQSLNSIPASCKNFSTKTFIGKPA